MKETAELTSHSSFQKVMQSEWAVWFLAFVIPMGDAVRMDWSARVMQREWAKIAAMATCFGVAGMQVLLACLPICQPVWDRLATEHGVRTRSAQGKKNIAENWTFLSPTTRETINKNKNNQKYF